MWWSCLHGTVSGVLVIEQGLMDVGTLLRRCRDYHRGLDADAAAMVADLLHRLYIAATACIGLGVSSSGMFIALMPSGPAFERDMGTFYTVTEELYIAARRRLPDPTTWERMKQEVRGCS